MMAFLHTKKKEKPWIPFAFLIFYVFFSFFPQSLAAAAIAANAGASQDKKPFSFPEIIENYFSIESKSNQIGRAASSSGIIRPKPILAVKKDDSDCKYETPVPKNDNFVEIL
eukprot:Sdes_comp19069_c0_seq1m9677